LKHGGQQEHPDHDGIEEHGTGHRESNISSTRLPLIANAPNTATMTAAAAVITRPGRARMAILDRVLEFLRGGLEALQTG
jgi:hypothetical protein